MASTITTWQAGKFYQPGDVVIPNERGGVTQANPGNAGFESGDTGWTKGADWTITTNDAFQGTWSAEYAGVAGGLLLMVSGSPSESNVWNTSNGSSFGGPDGIFNARYVVSSGSRAVALNADSNQERAYVTVDGTTWNLSTTIPWGFVNPDPTSLHYTALFGGVFFGFTGSTSYYRTTDGDTWTIETQPSSTGTFIAMFDEGSAAYGITNTGRVYKTTDGTVWSLLHSAIGFNPQSVIYDGTQYVGIRTSTGNAQLYTVGSLETSSWTQNSTGEVSIEAQLDGPTMNNGARIAYNGGTYVIEIFFSAHGAQTDHACVSTDLDTWAAVNTFGGGGLIYSTTLNKFVSTSGGLSSTDAYLNQSSDGTTWTDTMVTNNSFFSRLVEFTLPDPTSDIINDTASTVVPGQTVRVRCQAKTSANGSVAVGIIWYDDNPTEITREFDTTPVAGASSVWRESYFIGTAPPNADSCAILARAQGGGLVRVDNFVWEYVDQAAVCDFTYEATQATAAYSGTAEPLWPKILGNTVVDNAVTWTARLANCITYEAKPILKSGSVEPTFPVEVDGGVADNTILWVAEDQRVEDENCPNTKHVAIAASKIFSADVDVVAFSATINPLDWTTTDDAGFIPFGLNTYGANDITALGLYRSNLVVFNTGAFQMWQVDEDPTNMAILDAVPVGCPYYKSLSPVSNDLVFLTEVGIRSMGIAGASTNLQAGQFGKQVDPLVAAALAGIGDLDDIISLYYPGQGQYWLIFGAEAFVLTMNGGKADMSWSRYVFPSAIDDWTLDGTDLVLRSGDKIWRVDETVLIDDEGGADVTFVGEVWWPYLDFGSLGQTKEMIGFDTVATGEYAVVFGYNQRDDTQATASYTITNGDTVPGDIIPMPLTAPSIQMRLTFTGNTAWEWNASTLYVQDLRRTS